MQTLSDSAVNTPLDAYIARFTDGEKKRSAASQNLMIEAQGELLAPDIVPNPADPDNSQLKLAGQKFRTYFVIDPNAEKQLTDSRAAFERLGLLDENNEIDADRIVNAMKSGGLCFTVVLQGEEQIHRHAKKPGEKVGAPILNPVTKQPMSRGFALKNPFASDYGARVDTFPGLPEVPF